MHLLGPLHFQKNLPVKAGLPEAHDVSRLRPHPPRPDQSLPLNCQGRLAAHIVGYAENAFQLIDNAGENLLQQLIQQVYPASGHEVDGLDGAQSNHPLVAAAVADHADGLHRQEDAKRLAHLVAAS